MSKCVDKLEYYFWNIVERLPHIWYFIRNIFSNIWNEIRYYVSEIWEVLPDILLILIPILFVIGNVAMLICGAIALNGGLYIIVGGSISMVVLGSLCGIIPILFLTIKLATGR